MWSAIFAFFVLFSLGLLSDSVDMWSAVLVVSCLAFPGSLSMGLIFCIFVGLPKNTKTKKHKNQIRVSCLASPVSPSMTLNLLDLCLLSNLYWVPLHGSDFFGAGLLKKDINTISYSFLKNY